MFAEVINNVITIAMDKTANAGEKLALRRNNEVFNNIVVQIIAKIRFMNGINTLLLNSFITVFRCFGCKSWLLAYCIKSPDDILRTRKVDEFSFVATFKSISNVSNVPVTMDFPFGLQRTVFHNNR